MKRILPFIALAAVSVLSMFSCQQEPAEIRVSSISLSNSTLELTVGDQTSLDATVSPDNATNKKIRWSSSKESVATVTPDGIVDAVSAGTSFITARSEDSGVNAKCEITVKEKVISVTGIALNKTSLSLTEGEEFTLEATITPDNATNKEITWMSDNEAVATVSAEGVVKALRAGTASITATTVDQGKSASCTVTVTPKMNAITGEATHISCRNARLSGKANISQNTSTNRSFGVLYSTSPGIILLGSATLLEAKACDADDNYTLDIGVLEPETTYYYRSYIIQNDEVEYGEIKSFTTLAVSSMIQTLDASGVNPKDATLNAMLDLTDCKYNNIEYGFELTPEGGQAKTLTANNLADKAFSYRDETLIKNTKYSYSAYVILDGILYKAVPKTFTTASIQASLTAEASDVQYHSATISGNLDVQSEGNFSKSAILYYSKTENTVEGLKSNGIKKTLTLGADGSYTAALSSLPSSTSYNFIVVAKVDDVELVTEVKSFKTLTIQASVTAEVSDIQYHSAKISGSLTVQSEGSFSKFAILYYSKTEKTADGLKSNGTRKTLTLGADGSYSAALSSLPSSTSYNFIVVAKVDDVELVTEVKSFKTLTIQASVTAEASDIQYHSAKISGSLTVQSEGSFSKSAILFYSKTEKTADGLKSNGTRKTLTLGADGSYSAALSSLPSSTSYNFIFVAKVDDVEFVTEVKSFKTLTIQATVTAEASDVQCNSATISGSLSVQSEDSFSKSAVLYYSKTANTLDGLKSNGIKKTLTLGEDGSYTAALSSLFYFTSYNFLVVAKVDDVELVTEVKSFKTLKHPYELTYDLNVSSATDLSSSTSANCYIVSEPGLYRFKTVKGNSSTSVGNVASAAILWETFGTDTAPELLDLISRFCYKDGYIAFQTADTFKEGNAVIAAKDASGNILWSWHIWLTDQPQAHVYNNNAGTMMDRNLGATSATPGDVGALGLLYQWGRKDPFLGSSSISDAIEAKSTITWPSAVSSNSSNGTIDYATANPTTFITCNNNITYNNNNKDWYYTGDSSTDNTRWTTSSSDKSIYDPCPAGWRVPDGGSNGIWSKAGFGHTTYDSTNEGISFSISSPSTTWYPASGFRYYSDGGLGNVGNGGDYWSASPSGYYAYTLVFFYDGFVNPSYDNDRAFGFSVRCLQE